MRRLPRLPLDGTRSLRALVRELPLRALLPLGLAIFALFALLGPIVDIQTGGVMPTAVTLRNAVLSGAFAIGYAFGFMRRRWWLLATTGALQLVWVLAQIRVDQGPPS